MTVNQFSICLSSLHERKKGEIHLAGIKIVFSSHEFVRDLRNLGFEYFKPRTSAYQSALIAHNSAHQSLYILLGATEIIIKFYESKNEAVLDELGRVYTLGGQARRHRYSEKTGLHEYILELAKEFLANDFFPLNKYFPDLVQTEAGVIDVDLLLFDLDGTLLKTDDLLTFRGMCNLGLKDESYHAELQAAFHQSSGRHVYSLENLLQIRHRYPRIRLGIFTAAPKEYASAVVACAYPSFQWDCFVAFEDVQRTKPHGDGIIQAMQQCQVTDARKVVFIGDTVHDIKAAYDAGCWSVLDRSAWPNEKQTDHYSALALMPDAVIKGITGALSIPINLRKMSPALETAKYLNGSNFPKVPRYATSIYPCPLPLPDHFAPNVLINHLGRYFSKQVPRRACWNELNQDLIQAKTTENFSREWIDVIASFITHVHNKILGAVTVTVVPAKKGRARRLERLIHQISENRTWPDDVQFSGNLLRFNDRAVSQHQNGLSRIQRFENIRDTLEVNEPENITGRNILVLDDIVTSGASLFYSKLLCKQAGAVRVVCLSLAKTISHL